MSEEAHETNGNGHEQIMDESKINEVVKSLEEVSEEFVEQFKGVASKVVKKHGGDPAAPLAAAIAILSGIYFECFYFYHVKCQSIYHF